MSKNQNWLELAKSCQYEFPNLININTESGDLITLGANLEPETLIYAYSNGYFPMYIDIEDSEVLGWFSPTQRAVFKTDDIRITKSLSKSIKRFECRINTNFEKVIRQCMDIPRKGGWINEEFVEAYLQLHEMKLAHSVETYFEGELVGGLYGVGFAAFFAGESMFSTMSDASKVALVHLADHLKVEESSLLDAQWMTSHLKSLGATELAREQYLDKLSESLKIDSISWP